MPTVFWPKRGLISKFFKNSSCAFILAYLIDMFAVKFGGNCLSSPLSRHTVCKKKHFLSSHSEPQNKYIH